LIICVPTNIVGGSINEIKELFQQRMYFYSKAKYSVIQRLLHKIERITSTLLVHDL
jgi:hypothetical protein